MSANAQRRSPEERLLRLVAWLLTRRSPVTLEEIRDQFPDDFPKSEAGERKWTRDKQALKDAGVPVQFVEADSERPEGYLIDPHSYYLPKLDLTAEELAVLWTAGHAASSMGGYPWRADLGSALRKLRAVCGEPGRPPLPRVYHGSLDPEGSRRLDLLGDAVRRRKRIALSYRAVASGETIEREVDVYGLAWRRGTWLFVGHCHLRDALRVFYLGRVHGLTVNPKDPARADYEVPAGFDVRVFSRQDPWDYWAHAPLKAAVRLRGGLAALVGSLLPAARVESEGSEQVLARLEVRDLDALVRYVLSLGPEAELVEPEQGRERARAGLSRLAAGLQGGGK